MIIYVDASALVKRYIVEEGRELVLAALGTTSSVCTSTITYAEVRAAFARRWREGDLSDEEHALLVSSINSDWNAIRNLHVTDPLIFRAGEMAQAHSLRGFDAVQLASAFTFAERAEHFDDLQFLGFDKRLNQAARSESLAIFGDETSL